MGPPKEDKMRNGFLLVDSRMTRPVIFFCSIALIYGGTIRTGRLTSPFTTTSSARPHPSTITLTDERRTPIAGAPSSLIWSSTVPPGGICLPTRSDVVVHLQDGWTKFMVSGLSLVFRSRTMPSPAVLGGRKPKSIFAGSETKGSTSAIARGSTASWRTGGVGRLAGTVLSLGLAVGADAGSDGAGEAACAIA